MSQAQLKLELALSTRPTEVPEWVDVTSYLRGPISIRRGGSAELNRFETGTLNFLLDNRDRRFDPSYAGELRNLCRNPSVETDASRWSAVSATIGQWIGGAKFGSQCLYATCDGSDLNQGARYDVSGDIELDTQYTVSVYVRGEGTVRLKVYDVTNVAWYYSPNVVLDPSNYQRLTRTFQIDSEWDVKPEIIYVDVVTGGLTPVTFYIDGMQIEVAATATNYIDGDQDNCRWAGTPHASQSYYGGPYYGNLKPMRRVRLSALWGGGLYTQFTGYVEGWPVQFPIGNYHVPISAHDGFKVLAMKVLNDTYSQELSGARVNRVLDAVGWTTGTSWILDSPTNSQLGITTILSPTDGERVVMQGQTQVQGEALENANALDYLHNINVTENGLMFVSKTGAFTFHERHYRLKPINQTSKATFGDAAGELPFVSFEPVYDDSELYNEVTCTRKDGTPQTASDETSQLDYFKRTLEESELLAVSDTEMLDRATWMLSRRKAPRWRMDTLMLDPEGDDRLWPIVLGLELGDRITVNHRPAGGAAIGGDYWIRQISLDISEDFRWRVVYGLSPAETVKYWHVSDGADEYAPYAVLGTTTVLGY